MATSKQREKRRARRQRLAKLAKENQEVIEEVMELEDELPVEEMEEDSALEVESEEAEEKEIQKDMGEMDREDMGEPYYGPTSFDEMDAMKEAQMKASHVRELSYNVQDLVWNIVHAPMNPDEQSKAIKSVGDEFAKRAKKAMGEKMMMKEDIDLLQLEAIIAKDARSMSVAEKVGDWIEKKKLSYAAEKKLSDSDFALPSKRKYPIHDKAHVRNALARAAQQIKAGGEGAADAKAALPRIHAAAKKFGIGMQKEGGILIEKDASGSWRWVGYPTNNFKDHSGDIITEAAHQEYVEWVNKDLSNLSPVFTSCHAPGTARENRVDFVGYENGFVVMSGKLTELEAGALLKASARCDVGMSHTSWGNRDPQTPSHIIKYRTFEVTDLPIETADNPFTSLEISKEVDMNQLEYLTELLGSKEKAEAALSMKTSLKQKELKEQGVESKEAPTEKAPEAKPEVKETKAEPTRDEIVARVLKEMDADGLNAWVAEAKEAMEKLPVLEMMVKQLSQNRDAELAEMLTPKAVKRFSWSRASDNTENVIAKDTENAEDKKLVQNATGLTNEWAEAFHVTPLQQ